MFIKWILLPGLITVVGLTSAAFTSAAPISIFDLIKCPNWKGSGEALTSAEDKLCSDTVCPTCEMIVDVGQHLKDITWCTTDSIFDVLCDMWMSYCFREWPWHNNFCKPIAQEFKDEIITVFDFHWDPKYTPGLTNECDKPLCCREGNEKGSGATAAGYWIDYKCDIPFHTLENLFEHLGTIKDQFQFVYITGDNPAHNVWDITQKEAIRSLQRLVDLFNEHLQGKVVFPTFGNHESVPVNSFPPSFINGSHSLDWLLNATVKLWGDLTQLPAAEWEVAKETILSGGFYSVKVPQTKLRVISLQTNYCNNENFWLLINSTDPGNQLQWLVKQLLNAEKCGEKVHIIGHIPPGSKDCLEVWSNNYYKIVNRFESTIVGQFMGHTHKDSFSIFYDSNNPSRATNVLFIAPGVTSYKGLNLGFRIYTIDGSSYALIDHDSYYMDLAEANKNNVTNWQHEYSAKSAYNMAGMTPADWDQLVKQFQTNDTLFQEFYHNYYKQAPTQPCNSECKSWMLCNLVSSRSGDTLKCQTENHIDHDPQTCSDNFNNEHNSPITELNKPMLFRTEL